MSQLKLNFPILNISHRLMQAVQFGSKIIIDCSYDAHMQRKEAKNTAQQISTCVLANRSHADPFDLHICNANFDGVTMKWLKNFMPNLKSQTFPAEIHEQNVIDVFPKERLVYLTPHCDNELEEFSSNDIYIIGGIVDKHHSYPVSLEKATTMGLRMAKLPLDKYFKWKGGGGRCLTLNQVLNIMLDLKSSQDWNQALRHVPKRKMEPISEKAGEEKPVKTRENDD